MSAVRRVEFEPLGEFRLPPVAVREQALLVVEQLLPSLGRELEVRAFDDIVHRAGLLAHAAVDALRHVDVVPGGAAGSLPAPPGLEHHLRWGAHRLGKAASAAALLAPWVGG